MKYAVTMCLALLSALFVLYAAISASWRFDGDPPILLYFAYCIDHWGMVPYRDFFDFNMPGAYWAYMIIGRLSNYQDTGFRICDLSVLGMLLSITFLWQKKLSYKIAWSGAILFGIAYLSLGPDHSLQREFIALVPVVTGIYLTSLTSSQSSIRYYLVGFLFGLSGTIKPQMMIGVVPIFLVEFIYPLPMVIGVSRTKRVMPNILWTFVGGCTPILVAILWLYRQGCLANFLDVSLNYWRLYTSLSGSHESLFGIERVKYLYSQYKLMGGQTYWLIPGIIGFYISIGNAHLSRDQRHQIILLGLLTFFYSIYPILGGQFWSYHWIPFLYFATQLSSLCLFTEFSEANRFKRIFPIGLLLAVCLLIIPPIFLKTSLFFLGKDFPSPKDGRVDELATYLKQNLKSTDTVQPLDWAEGALHAMLISKAKLATSFAYDFHFYHHVSNPYIQRLRQRFLSQLVENKPRLVIDITETKHLPRGQDTTREFPELYQILNDDYRVAFKGKGFVVYEMLHKAQDSYQKEQPE